MYNCRYHIITSETPAICDKCLNACSSDCDSDTTGSERDVLAVGVVRHPVYVSVARVTAELVERYAAGDGPGHAVHLHHLQPSTRQAAAGDHRRNHPVGDAVVVRVFSSK